MLIQIAVLIIGFVALAWSADRFVDGAAGTATRLGLSPLIIGLVVVGFGTSAPEMLVSALAALDGNPGLAIGNALGSNTTNIALILGATALLYPIVINTSVIKREMPILFLAMAVALLFMWNGLLSRIEGAAMLAALIVLVGYLFWAARRDAARSGSEDPIVAQYAEELPADMPLRTALLWLFVGLAGLLLSSRALVWAAVELATAFGISDLIIGLTIVALGTSLPELAASIASARKGEHDLIVGNVIGSNIFNTLGVMGIAALLEPTGVAAEVLVRDFPIMVGVTIGLVVLGHLLGRRAHLGRFSGATLLATYVAYQTLLYFSA